MNPLVETLGRLIFGNIWTTTVIGSPAIYLGLSDVLSQIGHGKTVGEILMSPGMAALVAGAKAALATDPRVLQRFQFFFKD